MVGRQELTQVVEQVNEEFQRLRQELQELRLQLQGCLQDKAQQVSPAPPAPNNKKVNK